MDNVNMDDGNGHSPAWSGVMYGIVAMVLFVNGGFLLADPPLMDPAIFRVGGLLFVAAGLCTAAIAARSLGRSYAGHRASGTACGGTKASRC